MTMGPNRKRNIKKAPPLTNFKKPNLLEKNRVAADQMDVRRTT